MKMIAVDHSLLTRLRPLGRQIVLVVIALALATVFLAIADYPPLAIVDGLIDSFTNDLGGTFRWAAPAMLAGLAVAVAFKAGYWNLGVDGQICIGAIVGTVVALKLPGEVPGAIGIPLIFLGSIIGGSVYALIPALLKIHLKADEIVSTLLLNFIAVLWVEALVTGSLRDTTTTTKLNASPLFREELWLPRIGWLQPSLANIGFYIAVIACLVLAFVFRQTTVGQEIKMVGANATFADYIGVRAKRLTVKVFLTSGSIAGIVGACEITAVHHRLLAGFNPGFGILDGIVVALLAGNNPLGVLFSGLFFGALKNGGNNMERMTDVPASVTDIVMAIIILFLGVKFVAPKLKEYFKRRRAAANEKAWGSSS